MTIEATADLTTDASQPHEDRTATWEPRGGMGVARASIVEVDDLEPDARDFALGQSQVELETVESLVDGLFDQDDDDSQERIKDLAARAFAEHAARHHTTSEALIELAEKWRAERASASTEGPEQR